MTTEKTWNGYKETENMHGCSRGDTSQHLLSEERAVADWSFWNELYMDFLKNLHKSNKSKLDESKLKLECGRTPNRGNWVSAEYDGFKVSLYDDRGDQKSNPQHILKEMCLFQLGQVYFGEE